MAAGALVAGLPLVACSQKSHVSSELNTTTLFAFDTEIELSAYCDDETLASLSERCEYFENILSRTIDGSDVDKVNKAGGQPVQVNEETADVISKALEYSKVSDGLFDITIGAVSSLWDFVEGVKPDDADIKKAIEHVDWHCVQVDGDTITLTDPEAKIDLGGIAKGYIADDLKRMLAEAGVESGLINLGGNVVVHGSKPDGSPWKVGVQDPNGQRDDVIASIEVSDASVVTSGLYERQFTKDGVTYYHILDPKTGYPVKTDLLSSSIVSESSTDGDAYATILFLMGHDKAIQLLNETEGLEGLVVDDDDKVTTSKNAKFKLY